MALWLAVTISALVLVKAEPIINQTTATTPLYQTSTSSPCSCLDAKPTTPTPQTPKLSLGFIRVQWKGKTCKGDVVLSRLSSPNSTLPLCHDNLEKIQHLLSGVCERMKGCRGNLKWKEGEETIEGLRVSEDQGEEPVSCRTLTVDCGDLKESSVTPEPKGGSGGYKVATALLCLLLVALLLIRFAKPTVKALQRRLSDRRQSRWIGPTQSQSVSYHRGKAAAQNNDGDKRLSYPALERLTVSTSREPSSNRNSDYNY
ncbi:uncharacterized protein cd5 [Myripristis murdjan]|uniref:uncharacterized protein cd5 n=1 Tax=Myripristis murdjan TaxID=586833 RepID=UPI0011760ED6|nr:uncharacterized protein LOC115364878 [Myripristis murdjan]